MAGFSTPLASAAPMAACVWRVSSGVAAHNVTPRIADSLRHRLARIDFHTATIADDDDATLRREHAQIVVQIHVSQHLENDINAFAAGELGNLRQITFLAMIQNLIGAGPSNRVEPFSAPGGADDAKAVASGELHGRDAHAAAGAVHQHGLSRLARVRE